MSAYRCPASALVARNAAAKKTASSGKVYDAELFRRLAHNYGSVVDVIAPGAAGGDRDDFFRGDDGARGFSETASSLETRVRSSFLCLLYSFVFFCLLIIFLSFAPFYSQSFESALQQQQLVRQGYLLKKCGVAWRKLFFVLTPQSLSFFLDRDCLGALQVSSITEVRIQVATVDGRQRKGFSVSVLDTRGCAPLLASLDKTDPERAEAGGNAPFTASCAAASTDERNSWVKAIARAVRRHQLEAAFVHVAVVMQRALRSRRVRAAMARESARARAAALLQARARGRRVRAHLPRLHAQLRAAQAQRREAREARAAVTLQSWVRCVAARRACDAARAGFVDGAPPESGSAAGAAARSESASEGALAHVTTGTAWSASPEPRAPSAAAAEALAAEARTARDLVQFYANLGQSKAFAECTTIVSKYVADFGADDGDWSGVLAAKLAGKYEGAPGYAALPARRARVLSNASRPAPALAPVPGPEALRDAFDRGGALVGGGRGGGRGNGKRGARLKGKLGDKLGNRLKGKLSDTKLGTNLVTGLGKLKRQAQEVQRQAKVEADARRERAASRADKRLGAGGAAGRDRATSAFVRGFTSVVDAKLEKRAFDIASVVSFLLLPLHFTRIVLTF